MKENEKPFWEILSTKKGFKGNWIDIDLDEIRLPDGKIIEFEAVRYHRSGSAVAAENDKGEFVLVKSYRYVNHFSGWEIPAGTIPPGAHHSDVALEELREEAGCEADKKNLKYLGEFYPSVGSTNMIYYCYHAANVKMVTNEYDTNEVQGVRWFTRAELKKMILNFEIKDGFTLNVLMRVLFEKELME
jgi:ADP-ribose pyrophosphatase